MGLLTVTGLVAATAVLAATGSKDSTDVGCATRHEYHQLRYLMSPPSVARLFDTNGTWGHGGPRTFFRNYRTCWDPSGTVVTVAYDDDTALSLGWKLRSK